MPDLADEAHQAQKDAEKADRDAQENPSVDAYRQAAGRWRTAGDRYQRMADKGDADWCIAAEAYLRCAEDLVAQAGLEQKPADAVGDLKEAARVFEKAADLFLKCGNTAMDGGDYSRAIGAYAKAGNACGRREGNEQTIEDYFTALHSKNPDDNVAAGQTEQAEKRRKDAEKERAKAKEKQKKARDKFLGSPSGNK